jgi:hypothetical protein
MIIPFISYGTYLYQKFLFSKTEIVIFVLSSQNDCFLLEHENEFLVETVRSRLQTHSNAPTKQSSCALNKNTIFSTTVFEIFKFL